MPSWRRWSGVLAVSWAAMRVLSCGGDDADPNGTPDPDEGATFTLKIPAARGGTLATDQGWGVLYVGPGALAADTEMSLTPMPARDDSVTSVYEVGPEAVAFDPPAILSIYYDGNPGTGREPVLSRMQADGSWKALDGSISGDGRVTAGVPGAGLYAGVLRKVVPPPALDCAATRAGFTPCGGNLTGTWRILGACTRDGPFPLEAPVYCPSRTGTWDLEQAGILNVSAGYESVLLERDVRVATFQAPAECFPEGRSCGAVTQVDDWSTTCRASGDGCSCIGTHLNTPGPTDAIPIRIEGDDLVLLDGQGVETGRQPFCVSGSTAVVKTSWTPAGGDPIPVLWVAYR